MDNANYDINGTAFSGAVAISAGIVALLITIVYIWAAVRIIRRSGYSGWWILTALVPILNVVMYLIFAFKKTPAQRELEQWRMRG